MGRLTLPDVPTFTVLPYCDGDLASLPGAQLHDDSRYAFDDDVLRSTALVMGANHNFFNAGWTSDDWLRQVEMGGSRGPTCDPGAASDRLTAVEQRRVLDTYAAAWFGLTLSGESAMLPMFDGTGAVPDALVAATGAEIVTTATAPAGSRRDVARLTADSSSVTATPGASARVCASADGRPVPQALPACASLGSGAGQVDERQVPHWTPALNAPAAPAGAALDLRWSSAGAGVAVALPAGQRDLSAFAVDGALTLHATPAPGATTVQAMTLTVRDGAGGAATVRLDEVSGALAPLPGQGWPLNKTLLRGVRVPLAQLAGVNWGDVVSIELRGVGSSGAVVLSDLAVSRSAVGAQSGAPLPTLSMERTVVREGAGPGLTLLPVRLSGPAATAVTASVETVRAGGSGPQLAVRQLTFAPGQTCLTVPVALVGDRSPSSLPERGVVATAAAVTGAVGTRTSVQLLVTEDDGVTGSPGGPRCRARPSRAPTRAGGRRRTCSSTSRSGCCTTRRWRGSGRPG
ncbi:hypothetical protein [Litorihabitans aurantiacus]|uniref:Uncharacterized protein n=1 Tax=Litorihabitans aurantiacus TaxID=1930061 RepID=A0AA38CVJ5_9MICO|nr:hypothetical protein [Litorihabitans aurantiacus]GMA33399.1 hypothetical protein GCM10025875_33910 [Litorihabitans aurantiacus]